MITPSEAYIFLGDNQLIEQNEVMQTTLIWPPNTKSNWQLTSLKSHILLPKVQHNFLVETPKEIVIIPYIGDLQWINPHNNLQLEENQSLRFYADAMTDYQVINPYNDEAVCFFTATLEKPFMNQAIEIHPIEVQKQLNTMMAINSQNNSWIGQFDGRAEGSITTKSLNHAVLAYVIDGVFEVQNRLLHAQDALLLTATNQVDFEALSNNALILFFEIETLV